jgi:hypothetical protein
MRINNRIVNILLAVAALALAALCIASVLNAK